MGAWAVVELSSEQTHALRRRVLRAGTPSDEVRFEGDDDALHLATVRPEQPDTIVGVSTWLTQPFPDEPNSNAWRLRGMATAPEVRGQGAGAELVRAGLDRAREAGAQLVWARARLDAISFYEHLGFEPLGPVYRTTETAMDHRTIRCDL